MKQSEKRILIVDDDENILRSLGNYLSLKGYTVDTAKTGKEAVEKNENCFFNLAVLDIKLPDMDGTELLKKMRETEPKMMRIMLTGARATEKRSKMKRQEIPSNLDAFHKILIDLFGDGALILERRIARCLYDELNLEFEVNNGWNLADYVKKAQRLS